MPTTVIVLRHANAGPRAAWTGNDLARPLDRDGLDQALALVDTLRHDSVGRVLTSPTARCRHTVVALAAERRLPVVDAAWLGADTPRAELARYLPPTESVLLCTHGECVADLLAVLADGSPLAPSDPTLDKGAAWVLRFSDGRLAEIDHRPAPVHRAAPTLEPPRATALGAAIVV